MSTHAPKQAIATISPIGMESEGGAVVEVTEAEIRSTEGRDESNVVSAAGLATSRVANCLASVPPD